MKIDPTVTEMPKPIPWIRAVTIGAVAIIAKHLESGSAEGMKNEMAHLCDDIERLYSVGDLGRS